MQTQTKYADLTKENMKIASTIISKANPEWGTTRFTYAGQPLNDGKLMHTRGVGCNGSIMSEDDFQFWSVVTYK